MREKTKTVSLDGQAYQVRRFAPDVGSFILAKMLRAAMEAASRNAPEAPQDTDQATAPADPEAMVRMLAMASFGGSDFETHRFVQRECMKVCSRIEEKNGTSLPMPIADSTGEKVIPDVRDDVSLVMNLEIEALIFNFSDFFAAGGLNALARVQASTV